MSEKLISVIIPVYNASATLDICLKATFSSNYKNFEVIVVDDCSTDNSIEIIKKYPCVLIENEVNKGAAYSRNKGAEHAIGEILFFTDSDVAIRNDILNKINKSFANNKIDALIGSYTVETGSKDFFTNFKNISHHYTHQTSNEEATVFWTGCGIVKKEVFLHLKGFDEKYKSATIEDIQLGYRLIENKYKIMLNKKLLVTHYKRYNLIGLIKSDVLNRAIPWTKLILEKKVINNDQDLSQRNVLSSLVVFSTPLIVTIFLLYDFFLFALITVFGAFAFFIALNLPFLRYCYKSLGTSFTIKTVFMQAFFLFYSLIGFSLGTLSFFYSKFLSTKNRVFKKKQKLANFNMYN